MAVYWDLRYLLLLLFYLGRCYSQKSIYLEKLYKFKGEEVEQILRSHNKLRASEPAMNMQEMVWDVRLELLAAKWARRCDASHRPHDERTFTAGQRYVGENIWWSNELYLRSDLESPIVDFYNEKPFYDFKTTKCLPGEQCGHYTQVVWASSCSVGCAAAKCGYIKDGRRIKRGHIIICNYGPGGNKYQTRPYLYGPTCAACPNTCTKEGLCAAQCSAPPLKYRKKKPKKPSKRTNKQKAATAAATVPTAGIWPSSWFTTGLQRFTPPKLVVPHVKSVPRKTKKSKSKLKKLDRIVSEGPLAPVDLDPRKKAVCTDLRTECAKWAAEGGCVRSNTVRKLCRKTCVACKPSDVFVQRHRVQERANGWTRVDHVQAQLHSNQDDNVSNLISSKPVPKVKYFREGTCANLHRLCDFWADFGHCASNKDYMTINCYQACNRQQCGSRKATIASCADGDKSCGFWASIGECSKNKYFMEWKCPKVCRKCKP